MNLPNRDTNDVKGLKGDLHVLDFLFDERQEALDKTPFSYFAYMGSQTQPPCAEHVQWIVADLGKGVSSTVISMI